MDLHLKYLKDWLTHFLSWEASRAAILMPYQLHNHQLLLGKDMDENP